MINQSELIKLSYADSLKVFDLHFLTSYCADLYQGEWLVFKEDVYCDTLDLDKLAENSKAILFEKDLFVKGAITQEQTDYGPLVVIKGNVKAQNIFVGGCELFFRGTVTVDQTIIGIYNHGTIHIAGDVKAELIVTDDHFFDFSTKQVKEGLTYGFEQKGADATDIFKTKFYDRYNESLDSSAILKAILQGKSIKKDGQIQSPLDKALLKFETSKKKLLDLSLLNLKEIPHHIFDQKDILELDLSGNYIDELPVELLQLKQLKKIRLYDCNFTQFPAILLKMLTLEEIDLSVNTINDLPSEISKLTNLKKLFLYNCSFNYFPEAVYFIPQLEVLDISYQEDQPAFVIAKTFPKLKILNLSANFGISITALQPNLENLDIRNCSLSEIPIAVLGSSKLKKLDVTLNPVTYLPKEITNLQKIVHLALPLNYLDEESVKLLQSLPKLSKLSLELANEIAPICFRCFLEMDNWNELYFEGYLEDPFLIKEILERSNLKKLVSITNMTEEVINIQEARRMYGI